MEHELIQIRQTKKMGRGIFAKKEIPTGTNILTIEEDHFLTYTQVKQHRIFSRFQEDIESKIGCFAYYLAYCENLTEQIEDEIMTKEYVKELPEYFNNLICWDHDELQMLDNTPLKEKIRKIVGQYKLIYEKIVEALKNMIEKLRNPHIDQTESQQTAWESKRSTRSRPKKSIRHDSLISKAQADALLQVTFRQFLRLIAAIKSRNIYWQHQYDFQSEVGALIPYLEFFNHSRNSQCSVNQRNGSEQVISTKPIRKGEEIFVKYGDNISVQQFLEDYGMIPYDQWKSEGKQNGRACDIYQNNKLAKTVHEERVELAERYALIKEGQMGTVLEVKAPLCEKN